ncbi:BAG domain-containing protein Samui isoform X3 [Drosophila willistoni]|nr:BAG domain-containing protein Samui isoform X3 [Drosophila willistoni]
MDMDMDNMFQRSRLGRMHHDPFAGFGGGPTTRKRNSFHHTPNVADVDDEFSSYFDDAADFGFPQFSTMGRRGRATGGGANPITHDDDDFFHRLPSEFRQYIPEGFAARRAAGGGVNAGNGSPGAGGTPTQQQYYPQVPQHHQQYHHQPVPQSPSKNLCDAAIQTEDPNVGQSEVDCAPAAAAGGQSSINLNQHGLRNTMDMGVKSVAEQEQQGPRSHSAPPPEQQQQNLHYQQQQQQPQPGQQFGTQTTPPPQFHKSYYAPQQQAHPQQHQQKQQTPPPSQQQQPQTPGGSYIRTIPIFVEGRSEPIINAHKEIPNQNAPPSAQAQAQAAASAQAGYYAPQQQQQQQQQPQHSQHQQRPTPLNTHQQPQEQQLQSEASGLPPQTPHTLDSINKIQDIQRDVLDLMAKVEQFKGTREEKEYAYLDEMLTRNLLKLDTIDTNGKDSIRLARKEAIKCIQASINVLEAKAEENARMASGTDAPAAVAVPAPEQAEAATEAPLTSTSSTPATPTPAAAAAEPSTPQPMDATKIQEPIPLPPPPSAAAGAETPASAQLETTSTTSE